VLASATASAGAATVGPTCLPPTTQPFAAFGDTNAYFLLSGGAFEAGMPAWSLAGGAARVAGNNTAGRDPIANTSSLSLPAGSAASSPWVCVNRTAPSIRFFARNTGAAGAQLGVFALYTLSNGMVKSKLVAQVTGTGVWQPSLAIIYKADTIATSGPMDTTDVAFQFRPLDASGQWRIDDVYVDPFKRS
jgi:hypothetical protein